jgi:glycosyltransferase involved in cell wall biosynthesis
MAKILYLVTEAGYFFSHRLALAKAAQKAGHAILVATDPQDLTESFQKEKFTVIPLKHLNRSGTNPLQEISALRELYQVYKREKPDIVHHIAMKPVLYGSIAALLARIPRRINTFAGLGYLFISSKFSARFIRFFLMRAFQILFRGPNTRLILQNKDDYRIFERILPTKNLVLIRGSGVDTKKFSPVAHPPKGTRKVTLVARLLWDKGIKEAIEAHRILLTRSIPLELVLAGPLDPQNPSAIPESKLKEWLLAKLCTWTGKSEDVAALYHASTIAILPSYREGLPKALLEAAACGLPIITTDVPGCREIVVHKQTGLLVPPHNALALADAIDWLLREPEFAKKLGHAARESVLKNFSDEKINQETLRLYVG